MATHLQRSFLVLVALFAAANSAGLLETLLSWNLPESEGRSTSPQSQCQCQNLSCFCCIDLNLTTTIELDGPACLHVQQKEQNVSLNFRYKSSLRHQATIKIVDAANKPTCMNLLADLAQMCAKFISMKQVDNGFDGCLVLEPVLLSSPQETYHMGCFNFNGGRVSEIEASAIPETTEGAEAADEEEEEDGLNTEDLIAAVSAGAEQGIALFSEWLGLSLNPRLNFTSTTPSPPTEAPTSSRSSRKMQDLQDERNDERFKQLLSAQDNIQKGSATIGRSPGTPTTFIYSSPSLSENPSATSGTEIPQAQPVVPSHLVVVPKESRRGGRAYNIHQHVNEI
ncbi:uncharacterized protein [Prorops nasuta]|uniref:uncharacterized protein n=1 Tax=Prorops nasuta TaxID=863751 RepID=UPI0034CE684D